MRFCYTFSRFKMDVIINIYPSPSPIISDYFSPLISHTSQISQTISELDEIVLTEKEHTVVDLSGYLVQDTHSDSSRPATVLSFMKDINQKRKESDLDIDMIDFEEIKKEFDELLTRMSLEEMDNFINTIETLGKIEDTI
jgi:hypothetical protein